MFAMKAKQEKRNKRRKRYIIKKQTFLLKQTFFNLEMYVSDMRAKALLNKEEIYI